jgi:hypothetical protein
MPIAHEMKRTKERKGKKRCTEWGRNCRLQCGLPPMLCGGRTEYFIFQCSALDVYHSARTSTEFRGHRSDEPKMNTHLPPTSGKTGDLFLPPSEGQVEVNFLRPDMRSAGVTHHVSGLRFREALHCGLESKVDFQLDGRRIG